MKLAAGLVLFAASATASILANPVLSRQHLRLRGGEGDADDAAADAGVLTEQQITDKLNEVPTFVLMSAAEESTGFVALVAKDGGRAIVFFTEPEEAKAVLKMTQEADEETPLRLACVGLGSALKLCSGSAEVKEGFKSFDGDLRLQGHHPLVAHVSPKLKSMLAACGMEEEAGSSWLLPVFLSQELSSDALVPIFLNPREIKTAWVSAGQKEEDAPQKHMMIDIRMLINDMRNNKEMGIPWDKVRFVGADGAAEFANSLQQITASVA